MESITVENFNLQPTLECGQFFRYELVDDFYYVSHGDRLFKVKQIDHKLLFKGAKKEYLKKFFRLDDPYDGIIQSISSLNRYP